MMKKLPKANRKDEIAKKGMVNGGKQERTRPLVSQREKQASQTAQTHGKPVAEDNVHEAERQAAGGNHAPAAAKKGFVAVKEEGTVQEFLRAYRKERIQKHNQRPKERLPPNQGKEKFGSEDTHRQAQENQQDGISQEHWPKLRPEPSPAKQSRGTHCGIPPKNQKARDRCQKQVRNREIGNNVEKDQERRNDKERSKL